MGGFGFEPLHRSHGSSSTESVPACVHPFCEKKNDKKFTSILIKVLLIKGFSNGIVVLELKASSFLFFLSCCLQLAHSWTNVECKEGLTPFTVKWTGKVALPQWSTNCSDSEDWSLLPVNISYLSVNSSSSAVLPRVGTARMLATLVLDMVVIVVFEMYSE